MEICVYARPHLSSSPPGEEIANDGFEFSSGGSANSDAGHLVKLTMILPLLGERAGAREDYSTSSSHKPHTCISWFLKPFPLSCNQNGLVLFQIFLDG
jgi:hypothetical protein